MHLFYKVDADTSRETARNMAKIRVAFVKKIKQKEDKQLVLLDGKSDRIDYRKLK